MLKDRWDLSLMRIKLYSVLFITVFFSFTHFSNAEELPKIMPLELIEFGKKNHCPAIDEFYYLDGNIDPPFVYGIASGDRSNSAAFWCKSDKSKKFDHNIMIYIRDKVTVFSCSKLFSVSMSAPIGLRIVEGEWDLSEFDKEGEPVNESEGEGFETYSPKENANMIHSKALIMENIYQISLAYICYNGSWYNTILRH